MRPRLSRLPVMPAIEESVIDRSGPQGYDGPIAVGAVFAWEPDLPHARELLIVTRIDGDSRCCVIWTKPLTRDRAHTWNDESRFREAVYPTHYKPQSIS